MEALKDNFVKGALLKGVTKDKAEALFNLMAAFGEYGFNKSHSAAYAYLAYITAYLKVHYPLEFFAANLSNEMGDTNKILKILNECRSLGIEINGPDINESDRVFCQAVKFEKISVFNSFSFLLSLFISCDRSISLSSDIFLSSSILVSNS